MDKMELNAYLNSLVTKAIPFCLYRIPGREATLIIQQQPIIGKPSSSIDGFTIYPFTVKELVKPIQIRADFQFNLGHHFDFPEIPDLSFTLDLDQPNAPFISINKSTYLKKVEETLKEIDSGQADKIVLSRIIVQKVPQFDILQIFDKLDHEFSQSCAYLIHIPGDCIWFGASPEKLIEKVNDEYYTIALAGTAALDSLQNWSKKEIEEHAFVSRFIEQKLKQFQLKYRKSEIYSKTSGKVKHIAQDFHFSCSQLKILLQLFGIFHPGPAISGFPKNKAINLIYALEPHQREYYTGYFTIREQGIMSSWINIRCAKYVEGMLGVFVGGGITADSDPSSEWKETVLKSQTIFDIMEWNR